MKFLSRCSAADALRKCLHPPPNLIAHSPIMSQRFFFTFRRFSKPRRIIKTGMNPPGASAEDRTCFVGVVAYGDHIIKGNIAQLIDVLRSLAADVHSGLGHNPDGRRIHAMRLNTGRIRLDLLAFELPRESFGHLAAAGIAGAEEEDGFHKYLALPKDTGTVVSGKSASERSRSARGYPNLPVM